MNNGDICVSICAETAEETLAKIRRAEEHADIIEVRFDCLSPPEVAIAISNISSSKPLIATYRSAEQGGKSVISIEERRAFWSAIRGKDYELADLEEDIFDSVQTDGKRIVSFHDHNAVPHDIDAIAARMCRSGADLIKIAVTARDIVDAIQVWKLRKDPRVIPIAMGAAGKWTRILSLAHGSYLTYASLDSASATAAGQLTASELTDRYRAKDLDLKTKVYGVVGDPIANSRSPVLHNAAFAAADINAVFIPLEAKNIGTFIQRMVKPATREVELNFAGFAITMPHKLSIMPHLDEVNEVAQAIGAVNTVKIDEGRLIGFNTDAHGFITPLKECFGSLEGASAGVFGAGGAARACVYALKAVGAQVTVFARHKQKASEFAEAFGVMTGTLESATPSHFDIVINATPLGMNDGDRSLFGAEELEGTKFVYDLVTRITDTPLINAAKQAGVPSVGGLEMLIAQAEMQFEIWTGARPVPGIMKAAIDSQLTSNE